MWVRNRAGAYAYEKAGYEIGLFLAANKRYLGERESSPLGYSLQQVKSPLPLRPPPFTHTHTHTHTHTRPPNRTPAHFHPPVYKGGGNVGAGTRECTRTHIRAKRATK